MRRGRPSRTMQALRPESLVLRALGLMSIGRGDSAELQKILAGQESDYRCSFVQPGHFQVSLRIARHHVNPFCPAGGQLRRMSSSVERDILDVRFIRWPAIEVLIADRPLPSCYPPLDDDNGRTPAVGPDRSSKVRRGERSPAHRRTRGDRRARGAERIVDTSTDEGRREPYPRRYGAAYRASIA